MFALEVGIPSIDSPTSPNAAAQLLQCLREFAIEKSEASLEQVTGDKDSKLYQLLEPDQYPDPDAGESVEDAINRYFDYLQENIRTCYAGHYETVLVGFYAAKLMGFSVGTCIPVRILEYPKKKATRTTTFPSYTDAEPMAWGVSQIGECNGTDVAPMVFSYSHVDSRKRQGHFDVVAIADQTMTYSQRARVISFFRELKHNLKTSSPSLKRKASPCHSPASPCLKRRGDDDEDDVASEAATERQEAQTLFDLKVFFEKNGNIEPRDFSDTKRQVMSMLGGEVKARELLTNGTIEVALFSSEILTTRSVETNGMYGDFILLENYHKIPDPEALSSSSAVASSIPGSTSIFRHVASQSGTNRKLIAFASTESLRTLMEPCEVIKNGERAAIMAALDDTVYDYVQQFSQVPLVRLEDVYAALESV